MTREERQWDQIRADYLRRVEAALSSVKHPRARDVLDDVRSHLDRRVEELPPEQRTVDNLRAIVTEMGPPSEYAELLEPDGAAAAARIAPRKAIIWIGAAAVVTVVIVALILSMLAGPGDRAAEAPASGLDALPGLIAELSDPEAPRFVALNEIISIGPPAVPALIEEMRTSYNWQIPKALGAIGDWRAVGPLIEKLGTSDFSPMRDVVAEALGRITGKEFGLSEEKWRVWWEQDGQETGTDVSSGDDIARRAAIVYIVTFRPVSPFVPQTSRELLDAFNEHHPSGVRTHHLRTQVEDNTLIGSICVDTEAGKDAVLAMLAKSDKLKLVQARQASDDELEERSSTPQRPSSRSERSASRMREPASRNRKVARSGDWPSGDCSIYGFVQRGVWPNRISHAKVCLAAVRGGAWTVEAEGNGSFGFSNIPAGLYALHTTDTCGHVDTTCRRAGPGRQRCHYRHRNVLTAGLPADDLSHGFGPETLDSMLARQSRIAKAFAWPRRMRYNSSGAVEYAEINLHGRDGSGGCLHVVFCPESVIPDAGSCIQMGGQT